MNEHEVLECWRRGERAGGSALRTEKGDLYSYDLLIGTTLDGNLVLDDYAGLVSGTTTRHVNLARNFADQVRVAPEGPDCRGADISQCGRYRFRLWRSWGHGKRCVWLMLNPSTADAIDDDATIRRCIGFARRWGYHGIEVVNLYPLRETDAKAAMRSPDRFGPGPAPTNHHAVRAAVGINGNVHCAWGATKGVEGHATNLLIDELEKLVGWQNVFCLGVTKSGQPRHPVRLAYAVERVPLAVAQGRRSPPMTAEQWNETHPIGTPVRYFSVLPERRGHTMDTRTRSRAWTMGDGSVVVALVGRAGGVSIAHLSVEEGA